MLLNKIRDYRIFTLSIFDLVLSFIGIIIIFSYIGLSTELAVIMTLPIGILSHYLTGTPTRLNYYLGLSELPKN